MKKHASHRFRSKCLGFTLIELCIALGIFTFAVTAIIGLFPVDLKNASDTRAQTFITAASRNLIQQLRSAPFAQAEIKDVDGVTVATLDLNVSNSSQPIYLALDESGNVFEVISAGDYENGFEEATFLASVSVTPITAAMLNLPTNSPNPTESQITITLETSGAAPKANRTKQFFATRLRP